MSRPTPIATSPRRIGSLPLVLPVVAVILLAAPSRMSAQLPSQVTGEFFGLTTDGELVEGLFPVRSTGVSTAPVVEAAQAYLSTLSPEHREETTFDLESTEFRHWANFPQLQREGLSMRDMTGAERAAALELVEAGLSARGFRQARDVMRVAGHVQELMDDPSIYGENLYFISIMGEPSGTEPWGWQLDGYHLVVNYFVLGDQVVMTPQFWGIEPAHIESGPLADVEVLQPEEAAGLALMRSLSPDQQEMALIDDSKTGNDIQAAAFQDNRVMAYEGIPGEALDDEQRALLLDVIGRYVGNVDEGHAELKMEEVRRHLDETRFAWIGGTGPESVFYYRVHGPTVLIEFDHTVPVVLDPGSPPRPSRQHIHSLIRTPNGNDYGKDLLRQHYEETADDPNHVH